LSLVSEVDGNRVTQTISTDGSGNRVVESKCYDGSGNLLYAITLVTSPADNSIINSHVDNGDEHFLAILIAPFPWIEFQHNIDLR
jgi:hypothetical protein